MKRIFIGLFLFFASLNIWAVPVDVNTADAQAIAAALHGIGLKKAQAIVADRDANGPFKSAEDLERVKGIGAKTVAKNKADILIGGSVAAPAARAPAPAAPAAAPAAAPTPAPAAVAVPTAEPAAAPAPAPAKVNKRAKKIKEEIAVPAQ